MARELGRIKISEAAPNHPFAHEQISFVPMQIAKSDLAPGGSHGVDIWGNWGYERHDVHVSARKRKRIRAGEAMMVKSIGWYEEKSFECRWYFDIGNESSLIVSYGDEGADGFICRGDYHANIEASAGA